MNSGAWKFFSTIIFETRYTFAAYTGLYKSAPSIAFTFGSNIIILSLLMFVEDFVF